MQILSELLSTFNARKLNFRPTEIYNESWLVKLIMWQAATIPANAFPLGFLAGSTWFSEALLPTVFRARHRGDKLSEARTNADGVIGHFLIGEKGKADFELQLKATQFTLVEAKLGALLSKGTSNAKYFDQAARNVACMAEVLAQVAISPASLARLDFIVIAPETSIQIGKYQQQMARDSIHSKVKRRVSEYDGVLDNWYHTHFEPLLECLQLVLLSWEEAIAWISQENTDVAASLTEFYNRCLEFN